MPTYDYPRYRHQPSADTQLLIADIEATRSQLSRKIGVRSDSIIADMKKGFDTLDGRLKTIERTLSRIEELDKCIDGKVDRRFLRVENACTRILGKLGLRERCVVPNTKVSFFFLGGLWALSDGESAKSR